MYYKAGKSISILILIIINVILLNTVLPLQAFAVQMHAFRRYPYQLLSQTSASRSFSAQPVTSQSFSAIKLSDVSGNWAEKEIIDWIGRGLVKGYPDGTFKPSHYITRAEFIALINRAFRLSADTPSDCGDGMDTGWFGRDAAIAEEAGYISELSATGTFILTGNITRQETAVIICRLKSLTNDEYEAEKFADSLLFPDYFKGYIGAVTKAGYMKCYPDGNFGPDDHMTRAEAVVMLYDIINMHEL